MDFDNAQYCLNSTGINAENVFSDIPVKPSDNADTEYWLNVSAKNDEEYRDTFNNFNADIKDKISSSSKFTSDQKNIFIEIVNVFEKDCQLPSRPGFISSGDKLDKYNNTHHLQQVYMAIMTDVIERYKSNDEYSEALDTLQVLYSDLMHVKNFSFNPIEGIKALATWLSSGQTPTNVNLDKNAGIEYNLFKQVEEKLSNIIPGIPITIDEDELPGTMDYFNSLFGTGYLTDLVNYLKSNFYTT
jgi:hypothetical protein